MQSSERPVSEAFPAIPKSLQRRADGKHKPFRPSPLSGKSPSQVEGEGGGDDGLSRKFKQSPSPINQFEEEIEHSKPPQQQQHRSTPSSSSDTDTKLQKSSSTTTTDDDDISKLESILDARSLKLEAAFKRLDETKQNVTKLLGVLGEQIENSSKSKTEMKRKEQAILQYMKEMEEISQKAIKLRDEIIVEQTEELVNSFVIKAQNFLIQVDQAIREEEKHHSKQTDWKVVAKSFIVGILTLLLILFLLFILFYDELVIE